MKFSLCGGADAPDWILPHVSALSYISVSEMKQLAGQLISHILGGTSEYDELLKVTADSSLGGSDLKACVAALHFVIVSAAKFDVDPATLSRELQQLGLTREHSDALCKSYGEGRQSLQAKFLEQTLQGTPFKICGWQAESSELGESRRLHLQLGRSTTLGSNPPTKSVALSLTEEKFRLLLHELKVSRSLMESLM